MNIVKLKDLVKPNDDFFNKYLKGKYAWWIHMRYIVPFEHMGIHGYIACEEDLNDLFESNFATEFRDTYERDMWGYVDEDATDAANVIVNYQLYNKSVTDPDITVDELKDFRTWLAKSLLMFDRSEDGRRLYVLFDQKQTNVLEYYANNMYDEVVKRLTEMMSGSMTNTYNLDVHDCGCKSLNMNNLQITSVSQCDPISQYRRYIYNTMVKMFSDIDFWKNTSTVFLGEFRKYIDNIVRMNFNLTPSTYVDVYADCSCSQSYNNANLDILRRLSNSLQYMINNDISGHKNYIGDALRDWASKLYEQMKW